MCVSIASCKVCALAPLMLSTCLEPFQKWKDGRARTPCVAKSKRSGWASKGWLSCDGSSEEKLKRIPWQVGETQKGDPIARYNRWF